MEIKEGMKSPGTVVIDSCATLWFGDLNLGPLQVQPTLLTAKLSLQPPTAIFKKEKHCRKLHLEFGTRVQVKYDEYCVSHPEYTNPKPSEV